MPRRQAVLIQSLAACPAAERVARLDERLAEVPRCPVARYLAGCLCYDAGRPATAVRHMMIAHHAEPHLESAALLAFAGLNWASRRDEALLPVLLDTWEEFRRPEFDRYPLERKLLDAWMEAEQEVEQGPALARRLWRLPIAMLRGEIRAAVAAGAGFPGSRD